MSDRIRIVYHSAYHQRMAGANRSLYELVSYLDRSQFEPIVVFTADGPVPQRFRDLSVPVIIFDTPPQLNVYNKQLLHTNAIEKAFLFLSQLVPYNLRFARFLSANNVDIVHARDLRSLLLIGLGTKLSGRPLVCHVRGDMPNVPWVRWPTGLLSDAIVLVHQQLQQQIPSCFHYKCTVIYNTVSERSLRKTGSTNGCLQMHLSEYDGPVVTTFANVIPAKGLDYLVLAAEIIRERAPDIRPIFFIVGSTEVDELYYQSLQARVAEQELNVVFTGWQDDPYSFYENADIVVLPTLSEGFPRSVLEAMFCGIPVVASAVGGIPEIVVDGETGYLVPPGDANALANALLRLLRDPHLRIKFGRAGRERVQQHFSSEQMIEKIQALYLKLLASK